MKISCLCLLDGPWRLEENRPIVLETIAMFGAKRCMFASNFPVDRLRASYDMIYDSFKAITADLPRVDQEQLFSKTAASFYRIQL